MIDDAVIAAIFLCSGVIGSLLTLLLGREVKREWLVAPDPSLERDVRGKLEPLPAGLALSVSDCRGPEGRWARLEVSGVSPAISITQEPQDDELGDPLLHHVFGLRGPRSLLSAVMDADTRAALLALVRIRVTRSGSLGVTGGTLRVDVRRPGLGASMNTTVGVAAKVVALAERLRAPADVAARLAANALGDPVRGVRLANLRALLRDHAGQPLTRETLVKAAGHADPELRLMAASALGDEGRAVLAVLARDTSLEDETSAGAMDTLGALPLADVQAVLAASLAPGREGLAARPFTARACADLLATGGAAAVPLLARVVRSRSEAVALAGVRALRRIGTADVVLPLMEAVETGEDAVRDAARRAVDDIQAGLAGRSGALSLTGAEAGQVSVVEDPSGRVSLPPWERKG